jgi:hypothetical protein
VTTKEMVSPRYREDFNVLEGLVERGGILCGFCHAELDSRYFDCKRKYYKKRWFWRRSEMSWWGVGGALAVGVWCTPQVIVV